MLTCPVCHLGQSTTIDHLKHLRTCHPLRYQKIDYQCFSCKKILKWNGYRLHSHITSYEKPQPSVATISNIVKSGIQFEKLVDECFSKWKEVKGRANATSSIADEIFEFGQKILTMTVQMYEEEYDPLCYHDRRQKLKQAFDNYKSAYRRKNIVAASPGYIRPTPYTITQRFEAQISRNDVILKQRDNDLAYIKPRKTLETFLQKETVARTLNMPSHFVNNDKIDHVFVSRRCRELHQEIQKDFISVQLYADDFGTTNPLSHSATTCKMNAFYMRILNLPVELLSLEEFVILLSLAYTDDVKNHFQRLINHTLIPDFQELFDNGIDIIINGVIQNFPVVIFNVVGDNLGIHQLFGYVQSFNTLNPCRICKVTNQSLKTITSLSACVKKTETEYDELVNRNHFEQLKQNGIREKCSFNNLSYFHIYRSQCLDLMHDVLEGCAKYLMLYVLRTLDLDELNDAWSLFPFKRGDKSNSSMSFTRGQLQKEQLTGLTSSMMLTLIRFLPLVVHESNVEINRRTPWWSIYMDFVNIMDILMAYSLSEERLVDLQNRVESYLKRYQEAGGHMTVKSHFFLHDADVIREMGPLRWNWCIRLEAAHRQFKQFGAVNRNHQNVAMTQATKHQHSKMNFYTTLDDPNYLQNLMHDREIERFKPGTFIVLRVDDSLPVFGHIKCHKEDVDMFQIDIYKTLTFDIARHCYVIEPTETTTTVPPSAFFVPETMELYSEKLIRLPYCII